MILFAIFIYFTNAIDNLILSITYPFLEGSSEGKSVILFTVMGSILLLYPLFKSESFIGNKVSNIPILSFESQKYLKISIIIIFITYLIGLLLEIWLRAKFGVSPFTTFVSFGQGESSTSITHSHMLKSILGAFISAIGIYVPSQINTGISLSQYLSSVVYVIFIMFPLVYFTGLISLSNRSDIYKVFLAFGITVSLIGMLDGGLFSTPALIGLLILLTIYHIKKPFSPKNLTKPALIVLLLIFLRLSISIMGTSTEFHEITIINPSDNIDISGYDVISVKKEANKMIIKVPGNINDKVLLMSLVSDLYGKCSGFFLSWNIYSYV